MTHILPTPALVYETSYQSLTATLTYRQGNYGGSDNYGSSGTSGGLGRDDTSGFAGQVC